MTAAFAALLVAFGCYRSTEPGRVLAESADGSLCVAAEAEVQAAPGGFLLRQDLGCRFCPHEATVRFANTPPALSAKHTLVGATLVATHDEELGCGASACEHRFTAWWHQDGGWVIVEQVDGTTDELFGEGAPAALAWSVIRARCGDQSP